jgi:hypothetical protein
MAFTKVSIDESAKQYWKLLWGEYGEELVKNIPRRVKASLLDSKRVASIDENALVLPLAHAKKGTDLMLEGLYKDATIRLVFQATISDKGDIKDLKNFEIR